MKVRTFHNRIERQEFSFNRADVQAALKAIAERSQLAFPKPAAAVSESWSMEEYDGVNDVVLVHEFEYLKEAIESAMSDDAVARND